MQQLAASRRVDRKRSYLSKIRKEGSIPAIVYGKYFQATAIKVNQLELQKALTGSKRNGVIVLDIEGQKVNTVLAQHQTGKVSNKWIHIDFLAVDVAQPITIILNVKLIGEAQGEADGGVLQQAIHELPVTAKPDTFPEDIVYDVSQLHVNEVVTVADIKAQTNLQIDFDDTQVVCSILPPRQEEEINSGEKQAEGTPANEEGRETPASPESEMTKSES